jgi:hypothetical protein
MVLLLPHVREPPFMPSPGRGFASKVKIEPKIDCIKHKKGDKACAKPTFEAKLPEGEETSTKGFSWPLGLRG